jgi:hypothetical protein
VTVFPRIAALAAVVVVALAAAPTGASAQADTNVVQPTVLSVERYETPIDGWADRLIWSRRVPGGFGLIALNAAGEAVTLPIAPQPTPIDASIGPGPDGRPLIVYSQCKVAGTVPRGCDVYRLDPVTGNGGRVTAASHPDREERYPTIWANKIAFSLSVGKSPSRAGVAIANLDDTTAVSRPTIFGPRTERTAGRTVPLRKYGPRGIDMRNGRVTFSWQGQGRNDSWSLQISGIGKNASPPRQLLAAQTTSSVVSQIGRPAMGEVNVIVPVLRTGGQSVSEIVRTSLDGRKRWTLQGGFSAAQTEQYGAALTAVARPSGNRQLVVVRRLASDGRWACSAPNFPGDGGCELLRYTTPSWTPVATGTKRR